MIGVIGAIAYAIVGFVGIADTVGDFERVRPGSGTVTIESPGEYVVYFEDASPNGRVAMTAPSGEPVLLSTYSNELSYDFDGRNGSAVATFDATETGEYTIETDTAVAIGPSVAGELIRAILVPFAIAGIAFVLGVIILIVTGVQRSGSKRRLAQAAWHP